MFKSLRSLKLHLTLLMLFRWKAKEALKEGTSLVRHHIKLIRLVDKSEFGSMKQMSSHQIQRTISTSIVLKGGRRRSMRKKGKRNLLPSNQAFLPLVSFQLLTLSLASNGGLLRSSLGPCFACRKFGHHQTKCHQRAVFQPTSLDVAKPRSSG